MMGTRLKVETTLAQSTIDRMVADLRKHDAARTESDAIRCLMATEHYRPLEIAVFAEEARQLARVSA